MNILEFRRRLMVNMSGVPYNTYGYGVLYPKSAWRPHPHINIIYEMKLRPNFKWGVSFSDETEVVKVQYRVTNTIAYFMYMLNGIIHTDTRTELGNQTYTFPTGATERIVICRDVGFYGAIGLSFTKTQSQCMVYNQTNVGMYYISWCPTQQVLVAPECISYCFGQPIPTSTGWGGVIDTCWLDFQNYTSGRSYTTRWINNLELETVYLRKNVKTLGRNNGDFSFTGDSNLKDLYVEWTANEDILQRLNWMTFPSAMTLHIPLGTRSLYEAKGWGRYNIVEYKL